MLFGSLDSTTGIAEDIGRQLLVYGRRMPTSELLLRVDAVDAAEVKRVAKERLWDADIALAALGPFAPPSTLLLARRAREGRFGPSSRAGSPVRLTVSRSRGCPRQLSGGEDGEGEED